MVRCSLAIKEQNYNFNFQSIRSAQPQTMPDLVAFHFYVLVMQVYNSVVVASILT